MFPLPCIGRKRRVHLGGEVAPMRAAVSSPCLLSQWLKAFDLHCTITEYEEFTDYELHSKENGEFFGSQVEERFRTDWSRASNNLR